MLSCPEEEEEEVTPSPKEEMRKTRKEEIFHEMLTEKSEPQLQTLPVPPLPSTEVLVLLTDERRFKEDVSLETSSSEEGLRVLSTIAAKTDDNQPEMNLTETKDISYLHLLDISVSYTETAQEQPSMPNLNPTPSTSFQIPGLSGISVQSLHSDGSSMEDYKEEVSSNDSEFDMESSEFSKEFRESIHSREYSKLEQEYYDGIARSFPVCEPVEEKSLADWRIALLPKEFYKTKFVQTNLRMRKSNLLNVMFEQSLNSLFSDTILHQPAVSTLRYILIYSILLTKGFSLNGAFLRRPQPFPECWPPQQGSLVTGSTVLSLWIFKTLQKFAVFSQDILIAHEQFCSLDFNHSGKGLLSCNSNLAFQLLYALIFYY